MPFEEAFEPQDRDPSLAVRSRLDRYDPSPAGKVGARQQLLGGKCRSHGVKRVPLHRLSFIG
jgi:hypothetical protein